MRHDPLILVDPGQQKLHQRRRLLRHGHLLESNLPASHTSRLSNDSFGLDLERRASGRLTCLPIMCPV